MKRQTDAIEPKDLGAPRNIRAVPNVPRVELSKAALPRRRFWAEPLLARGAGPHRATLIRIGISTSLRVFLDRFKILHEEDKTVISAYGTEEK